MSSTYTGPKKRAEDYDRRWKWSEWFTKYSFVWWPIVLAGVAYPAKVVHSLRSDTKNTVDALENRIQPQIDTLKVEIQAGKSDRKQINDKLDALLRKACADQSPREQVLTGTAKACAQASGDNQQQSGGSNNGGY